MILEILTLGALEVNCYIIAAEDNGQAIIIDPGAEENKIKQALNKHRLKPAFIINTHGHYDHIGCDDKFDIPVYIHTHDSALLKDSVKSKVVTLEDKQPVELEGIGLEVIHTPGHTPGGICLFMHQPKNNILFSGDTLFFQGIGRTDFPGASEELLLKSIREKLFKLPDETIVYPGHGPATTIGEEKQDARVY